MKRKWFSILLALLLAVCTWWATPAKEASAACANDLNTQFRSTASGNWATTATWECSDNGTDWEAATVTPTSSHGAITIRNGHTVTVAADVTVDQVVVEASGQVTINSGQTWELANDSGTDISINGTVLNQGTFSRLAYATWTVNAGGIYIHNTTTSILGPLGGATLDAASNFIYRGSSSLKPAISMSGRTYGNLTFESTSGSWSTGALSGSTATTIQGNFTIGSNVTFNLGTLVGLNIAGTLTNNGALEQTQSVSGSSDIEFLNISTNKYYGVMINPGGNDLGSTAVTIYGNQTCSDAPNLGKDPIKRCFYIEPTTQLTATVKLYYLTSELNGNTASSLNIYHEKNNLWYLEGGEYTREANGGDYDWVQVTGVDEYSPFTGGLHNEPTLIELASFTATPHDGYVLLEWETASEIDNAGFNLWRSQAQAGPYTRLNAQLIPVRGGPTTGASYSYDDDTVTNGVTYWYKLEDVNLYGVSTLHGPVRAVAGRDYRLYLPLVVKGG